MAFFPAHCGEDGVDHLQQLCGRGEPISVIGRLRALGLRCFPNHIAGKWQCLHHGAKVSDLHRQGHTTHLRGILSPEVLGDWPPKQACPSVPSVLIHAIFQMCPYNPGCVTQFPFSCVHGWTSEQHTLCTCVDFNPTPL